MGGGNLRKSGQSARSKDISDSGFSSFNRNSAYHGRDIFFVDHFSIMVKMVTTIA
jgi:hypothetical protein